MKTHKKNEHTYHIVRYQCDECDFMANEVITLQVHFGMKHSLKKQCGLCDKEFDTSTELDDHQSDCEIYLCSNSHCKDSFGKETDLKEHINETHRSNSPSHYQFSYWIINTKDKSNHEVYKKYITIYLVRVKI